MPLKRQLRALGFGVAATALALAFGASLAQEADEEPAADDEEMEEIVVIAPKPGSRRRLDEVYEDPLRARILKDLYEMRADQEESEWRQKLAEENDSRIKLGYDPRDEYRLRNEMDLTDLPMENNKPATLFRIGF